jgi:mRNA deadenylase 3'-5' endonuclease subunit Ccr4
MEPLMNPPIKFMSWNILSRDYVKNEYHLHYDDSLILSWDHRHPLIIKEIKEANPDVFCLQEVTNGTVKEDFKELFSDDASSEYSYFIQTSKDKIVNCTAWKKSLFKLKSTITHSCAIHCNLYSEQHKKSISISNIHLKGGLISGEQRRLSELTSCFERLKSF